MLRTDKNLVYPTSLPEFIAMMNAHADETINWSEAHSAGACIKGLRFFQHHYFPGRTEVTVAELVPLVRYRHFYWHDTLDVVINIFALRGMLRRHYNWRLWFRPPVDMLRLEYLAS